jgi:hypothetical protein
MNDEELRKLWQQQPMREPAVSPAAMISAMQSKTTQLRRELLARDARELVACVFVIIIFGYFVLTARTPIVRLGYSIVIASAVFIAGKLLYTRRSTPPAPAGATVVESLRAELNAVRAQSRLLGSVLLWYLLPLGIGLLVATWGMPVNLHAKIPATIIYFVVYGFVYWLNRWARAIQLLPLEKQLAALLHSAETGAPLDETEVANLRPLAIAAAKGIKPLEFKVAFGQVAIYGEIGFVGIWFFWMLSREGERIWRDISRGSMDFLPYVFSPKQLLLLAGFFLGGLVYSWLIQRMTTRAVGISSLGVHLLRGQTVLRWEEIKEVRPFRFLNIRSLWLIREAGEKMIMPWSSLERQSDLKAAVERFAPAAHPLRKYLSVLRCAR